MFARIRRAIGAISVTEIAGQIHLEGIPANFITADIRREWGTSRINSYMFTSFTPYEIKLPSFFALEFLYILEKLRTTKGIRTNRRALDRIIRDLKDNTWLKNISIEHEPVLNFDRLKEIKLEMKEHQLKFLKWNNWTKPRYGLNGTLLSVPPGGGKTVNNIALACCAEAEVTFIISPLNAVDDVWNKTLKNEMVHPQKTWVASHDQPFDPSAKWCIFHFERLAEAVKLAAHHRGKRAVVILDESHGFNDMNSQRTALFLQLCQVLEPTDVIWASGTPIKAIGSEAVPLLRTIDPLFTEDVEARFKKMFAGDQSRAYDILNNRLGMISFKVPKSAFMTDEKPIVQDIYVEAPNSEEFTLPKVKEMMEAYIKERTVYYSYHKDRFYETYMRGLDIYEKTIKSDSERVEYSEYKRIVNIFVKQGFDNRTMGKMATKANLFEKTKIIPALPRDMKNQWIEAKSVVKYVMLKIRGECLGRVLSKQRERCHVAMVRSIDFEKYIDTAEKKTLVFTSFVPVVDEAFNFLKEEGYKPLRVYGDTNNELTSIIKSFREDEDVNPVIATYQSLSTAVPMTEANVLLLLNSPFRFHEQNQAISRCWRMGQDTQVYVYRFFLKTGNTPNLSTRSEDIQEWSRQMVDAIIGIDSGTEFDMGMECYGDNLAADCSQQSFITSLNPSRYW